MNFSLDRDLLALESGVFTDVAWAGQKRVSVTDGVLAGGVTLTSASADFSVAQVETGAVVLIGDEPLEVITRTDANTLSVSRVRTSLSEPSIPASDLNGSALTVTARTFSPQAALVHDGLLRLLGIDPDDPDPTITEDAILSLSVMARLEAIGTLERIYSGAATITGGVPNADADALAAKAAQWRTHFTTAINRATVLLDIDGDGRVDDRRALNVTRLVRV